MFCVFFVFPRLSYHQRILDVVPENFRPLCPEKPEVRYKYKGEAGAENAEACSVAAKVEAAIKAKAPQEEILAVLKEATDEEQNEQFSPLKVRRSPFIK